MKKTKLFYVLMLLLFFQYSCSKDDGMEGEVASCTDGIQNQDETGIDCGGACGLCGPPNEGYYFYGVIDGEEVVVSGANGVGAGSCSNFKLNGGGWLVDFSTPDDLDATILLIKEFPGMGFQPDKDDYYEMYELGSYSYASGCDTEGAEISWVDDSGSFWATGLGDQSGSSFEVTERGAISTDLLPTTEVRGKFSCKLYNGNEVKTLESGEFYFLLGLF